MSSLNIILKGADFSKVAVKQVETDIDIPITAITLDGNPTIVNNQNNSANFSPLFVPSSTTQKRVDWTLQGGTNSGTATNGSSTIANVASIDRGTGLLTVATGANNNNVTVVCTSIDNSAVSATWPITITYQLPNVILPLNGASMTTEQPLNFSIAAKNTVIFTVNGGGYIKDGNNQTKSITVNNNDAVAKDYIAVYSIKLNAGDSIQIGNALGLTRLGKSSTNWQGESNFIANTIVTVDSKSHLEQLVNINILQGISTSSDDLSSITIKSAFKITNSNKNNLINVGVLTGNNWLISDGANINTASITQANSRVLLRNSNIKDYNISSDLSCYISCFNNTQCTDNVIAKMFATGKYNTTGILYNAISIVNSNLNATSIATLKRLLTENTSLSITVNGTDVKTM